MPSDGDRWRPWGMTQVAGLRVAMQIIAALPRLMRLEQGMTLGPSVLGGVGKAMAQRTFVVVRGVPVQCEFPMPPAPDGMTINYEDVRVSYTRGDGTSEALTRVADAAACTDGAWYYDDPAMPTEVRLCPALCTRVQADEGARMDVGLGCFPILD